MSSEVQVRFILSSNHRQPTFDGNSVLSESRSDDFSRHKLVGAKINITKEECVDAFNTVKENGFSLELRWHSKKLKNEINLHLLQISHDTNIQLTFIRFIGLSNAGEINGRHLPLTLFISATTTQKINISASSRIKAIASSEIAKKLYPPHFLPTLLSFNRGIFFQILQPSFKIVNKTQESNSEVLLYERDYSVKRKPPVAKSKEF